MKHILAVAFGGALGAICRHLVNQACSRFDSGGWQFPWGTLTVNVVGCFLIGLLLTMRAGGFAHPALTVGFLGALTTFSTFGFETHHFFSSQQHGLALLNIGSNMLMGLLAVFGGIEVGKWLG